MLYHRIPALFNHQFLKARWSFMLQTTKAVAGIDGIDQIECPARSYIRPTC